MSSKGTHHKTANEAPAAIERATSAKILYDLNRNLEALDSVLYELFTSTAATAIQEAATGKPGDASKVVFRNAMFRDISKLAQALHDGLIKRSENASEPDSALSRLDREIAEKTDKKDEELANKLVRLLGARYGMDIWIRDDTFDALEEMKNHIACGRYNVALDCLLVTFFELSDKLMKEISKPNANWVHRIVAQQQELSLVAVKSLRKRSIQLENSKIAQEKELSAFDSASAERIESNYIKANIDNIIRLLAKGASAHEIDEARLSVYSPDEKVVPEVKAKIKEIAEERRVDAAARLVSKLAELFHLQKDDVLSYLINEGMLKSRASRVVSRISSPPT